VRDDVRANANVLCVCVCVYKKKSRKHYTTSATVLMHDTSQNVGLIVTHADKSCRLEETRGITVLLDFLEGQLGNTPLVLLSDPRLSPWNESKIYYLNKPFWFIWKHFLR
jgi:hypothetical protein